MPGFFDIQKQFDTDTLRDYSAKPPAFAGGKLTEGALLSQGRKECMQEAFLAGACLLAVVLGTIANTHAVRSRLGKTMSKVGVPKAVDAFIFVAQASELAKTVQHITIASVLTTILLFVVWIASRSGTEEFM